MRTYVLYVRAYSTYVRTCVLYVDMYSTYVRTVMSIFSIECMCVCERCDLHLSHSDPRNVILASYGMLDNNKMTWSA